MVYAVTSTEWVTITKILAYQYFLPPHILPYRWHRGTKQQIISLSPPKLVSNIIRVAKPKIRYSVWQTLLKDPGMGQSLNWRKVLSRWDWQRTIEKSNQKCLRILQELTEGGKQPGNISHLTLLWARGRSGDHLRPPLAWTILGFY